MSGSRVSLRMKHSKCAPRPVATTDSSTAWTPAKVRRGSSLYTGTSSAVRVESAGSGPSTGMSSDEGRLRSSCTKPATAVANENAIQANSGTNSASTIASSRAIPPARSSHHSW
ncbi:hypothetical protein L599_003700000030 [Luteimonas sp. J16]|nr:hypothetical protein L599_003700000030 [Luteimonas sp. J16]